jgi:hypothetical protein
MEGRIMQEPKTNLSRKGDAVMKKVGSLDTLTKELSDTAETCKNSQKDVGSWITTIGKAIIAIFTK